MKRLNSALIRSEHALIAFVLHQDSIMTMLPPDPSAPTEGTKEEMDRARMQYVFAKGHEISAVVCADLPPELILEPEGVMWPALFLKKKHYAAVLWEQPERPKPKLKMKGIVAVRNDYSRLAKRVSTEVLRIAIYDNNPAEAVQLLQSTVAAIKKRTLPIEDYIISKQLHSLTPKVVSPHVALCQRLALTSPMEVPPLGTRVSYVIVTGSGDLSWRSRRPQDVTVANIDAEWYIAGLLKPLMEMMSYLVPGGYTALRRRLEGQQTLHKALQQIPRATTHVSTPLQQAAPPTKRKTATPQSQSTKKQCTMGTYMVELKRPQSGETSPESTSKCKPTTSAAQGSDVDTTIVKKEKQEHKATHQVVLRFQKQK